MRHLIPEPIQGLPQYGLGIIGMANFDSSGASIATPFYFGVIRSVEFVGTGTFKVNLFPEQLYYTVWCFPSGDLFANTAGYLTSKALTTRKSFQFEFARCSNGVQRNPAVCNVLVFGGVGPQC